MGEWQLLMAPSQEVTERVRVQSVSGTLEEDFKRRSPIPGPVGEREFTKTSPSKNEIHSVKSTAIGTISPQSKTSSWLPNPTPHSNSHDVFSNSKRPVNSNLFLQRDMEFPPSTRADDEHRKRLEDLRLSAQEQFGDWLSSPRQGQVAQNPQKDYKGNENMVSTPHTSNFSVAPQNHNYTISQSSSSGQGLQSTSQSYEELEVQQREQHEAMKRNFVVPFEGNTFPASPQYLNSSNMINHSLDQLTSQQLAQTPQTVLDYQDELMTEQEYHMRAFSPFGNSLPLSSAFVEPEYSVFVGDLCPDLREEDLVNQFLNPPIWPPSHPFAIAHAHAQQAQGRFGTPPKIGPAPFVSTKSAAIMTDPLTGVSRGFGFVRFTSEIDCARALVEMQGITIHPFSGQGGRPLRVCPATPKNRSSSNPTHSSLSSAPAVQEKLMSVINAKPEILSPHERSSPEVPNAALKTSAITPPASSLHHSLSMTTLNTLTRQHQFSAPPLHSTTPNSLTYDPLVSPSLPLNTTSGGISDVSNTTVFVGGLSSLISEETLKTFFVPFGEIKYVKIPPGKGCGFVQFVNKTDAERAIDRMQGFPIGGGKIRLSWGRSQSDKQAAAAAQAAAQAAQIGHLAGLAGLSSDSTSQLTAAHLAAGGSGSSTTEAHAQLIKQLAAVAMSGSKMSQRSDLTVQQGGYFNERPTAAAAAIQSRPFDLELTKTDSSPVSHPPSFGQPSSSTFDPFASDQTTISWSDKGNYERIKKMTIPDANQNSSSSQDLLKVFASMNLDNNSSLRADQEIWSKGGIGEREASSVSIHEYNSIRQRHHTLPFNSDPWKLSFSQSSLHPSAKPFVTAEKGGLGSINQQNIAESSMIHLPSSCTGIKRPSHPSFLEPMDPRFNPFASDDLSPSLIDEKVDRTSSPSKFSNKSKKSDDDEFQKSNLRQSSENVNDDKERKNF